MRRLDKRNISIYFIVLLLICSFILFSCDKKTYWSEYEKRSAIKYVNNLEDINSAYKLGVYATYEYKLAKPVNTIKSYEDIVYILDYLAFYKISTEIKIHIDRNTYKSEKSINDAINKGHKNSHIAYKYALSRRTDSYRYTDYIAIKLHYIDFAEHSGDMTSSKIYKLDSSFDKLSANKNNELIFNTDKRNRKLTVDNSEQLFYAAQMGYMPNTVEQSTASKIYGSAKSLLNKIIDNHDTNIEKLYKVYSYLINNIHYDRKTHEDLNIDALKQNAYYLEGVFFDKTAVCDGLAKSYSLLSNMLGIINYKVHAQSSDDKLRPHAYNYVMLDGKYYISCCTYAKNTINYDGVNSEIISYNFFLQGTDMKLKNAKAWPYKSDMFEDVYKKLSNTAKYYRYNINLNKRDFKHRHYMIIDKNKIEEEVSTLSEEVYGKIKKVDGNAAYAFEYFIDTHLSIEKCNELIDSLDKLLKLEKANFFIAFNNNYKDRTMLNICLDIKGV